ncbi:hypothetical protein JTE90_003329 [Oedothorax gibbosus]|uniref:B-block binding subunit of TFIIIC domain-containing protein n=1 Tax=Oedothorax gibbosus TaxID=931172 RepID=A0AAV6UH22_9ARAC|nr:hypothetical protein JTE90_003329 [Oedothorax gibbosus]
MLEYPTRLNHFIFRFPKCSTELCLGNSVIFVDRKMTTSLDFASCILDEISLEGLDGITLETLWQRLKDRPHFPIPVDDDSKKFFWKNIAKVKDIEMYLLPKPRKFVPIFDRYSYVDPVLDIVIDPPFKVPDPHYPIAPVEDGGVRGSCSMYKSRTCITPKVRCSRGVLIKPLEQVVKDYGDSMVLVASPKARLLALIGSETNPLIDMSLEEYCLLERIGRSRYLGEVTQGENGLLCLKAVFCKHLHYYKKKLAKKNLITKQDHVTKTKRGQTSTGSLLHLTRFYVLRKTKMACLLKNVCDILKDRPQNQEACTKIRDMLGSKRSSFKNLFTKTYQKWLGTSIITCRELYPNGTKKDWYTVNGQEKTVKVLQLVKHCEDSDEDSEDEDQCVPLNVYFDYSKITVGVPFLYQMYCLIKKAGPEGITSGDLGRAMTLPKLEIRNIIRFLERKDHIFSIPRSRGRQTVYSYISNDYKNQSEVYSNYKEQEKRLFKPDLSNVSAKQENRLIKTNLSTKVSVKRKFDCAKSTEDYFKVKRYKQEEKVDTKYSLKCHEIQIFDKNNENMFTGIKGIKHKIKETTYQSKLLSYSSNETETSSSMLFTSSKQFTYRKFKRCNIILDFLDKNNFVTTSDLQKHILQKEKEEGYNFALDRRSLFRLIESLIENDKIKKIIAELEFEEKLLQIEFVSRKSFQSSDPRLVIAIDQAKYKWFSSLKSEGIDSKPEENNNKQSNETTIFSSSVNKFDATKRGKFETKIAYKYPHSTPKFVRVKALHLFLYYLVYDNKHKYITNEEKFVYHDSMTWKRYVPPLPDYGHNGWFLITDIYSRLPLSLFTMLVHFKRELRTVEDYLKNEETANYLIKFLPNDLRNGLLRKRKYICSVNEAIRILCYMGLVSIGPEVGKQKDQSFIYVHKKATLKDTSISSPSYVHIDVNIEYSSKYCTFANESDLKEYWLELETICFHTPLGKYSTAFGKTLKLVEPALKPELMNCTKNIAFDGIRDEGFVPGDGLGAAGYDSSLFLHLRRNWKESTNDIKSYPRRRLTNEEKRNSLQCSMQELLKTSIINTHPTRLPLKRLSKHSLSLQEKKVRCGKPNSTNLQHSANTANPDKGILKNKRKIQTEKLCCLRNIKTRNKLSNNNEQQSSLKICERKKATVASDASNLLEQKKKRGIKLVTLKRRSLTRVPFYDEKDKLAMAKLNTTRCQWSPQEDSFLLLCKVASCFLQPSTNTRTIAVHYSIVRDLLHENVPDMSSNKTSLACQRRMKFFMRHPETVNNVKFFLEETLRDAALVKEFSMPKPTRNNIEAWRVIFTKFMKELRRKFVHTSMDRYANVSIPRTMQDFHKTFNVMTHTNLFHSKNVYNEPENEEEIQKNALMFLILSAMAVKDEAQWTPLLNNMYQSYSESILQTAVAHLRKETVISVKSKAHRSDIRRLCQSTSPYKFSISYHFAKIPKFRQQSFEDAKQFLSSFNYLAPDSSIEVKGDIPTGFVASVLSLLTAERLQINFKVPEQVLMFDLTLTKKIRNNMVDIISSTSDTESKELLQYLSNDKNFLPDEKLTTPEHSKDVTDLNISQHLNLSITNAVPQSTEVHHSAKASRFALYFLRHELSQQNFEKGQKSQDYIALNACKIFCSPESNTPTDFPMIPPGISEETPKGKIERGISKCTELNQERMVEISNILTSFIPCRYLTTHTDYFTKIQSLYELYQPQTFKDAKCIFHDIYEAGVKGLSEIELLRRFSELLGELSLFEHLFIFRESFLVLRVGVAHFTYVVNCFASKWVVPSFQTPIRQRNISNLLQCNQNETTTNDTSYDKIFHNKDSPLISSSSKEFHQGHFELKINFNQQLVNSSQKIQRYFIPRTWRNPDGSLNKPVLFDLLFTILSYLVSNPASTTSKICEHFSLVFPPVQLLELLEVLEMSNCVYKYYCKPIGKATLFSTPPTTSIALNAKPFYVDHIEAFPDAVCKIAKLMDLLRAN